MSYDKRLRRLLFVLVLLVGVLLIPYPASAYVICNDYPGGCTICDFFGPNSEYQGYMQICR